MKKTQALLLSLPLIVGLAACSTPNTTAEGVRQDQTASDQRAETQRENAGEATGEAASRTGQVADNAGERAENAMQDGAQTATGESGAEAKDDAASDTRERQLESDIRAREQRTDATGQVSDGDIESKVRSKLEANIQQGSIAVTAQEGNVTLKGRVPVQSDIDKAVNLAKEINGVKQVQSELTVGKG
ncbi:MAG: BON domain-containing protein [Aphanocapsa lilacina HA4352-LM1]|jgi:osmotically-inducible protein OsmY|nr:BON domain-containing protein [Aphanocapsa lilacina HA4352-LM1]